MSERSNITRSGPRLLTNSHLKIIRAGGDGSGCDPQAAKKAGNRCGRPPSGKVTDKGSMFKAPTREFSKNEKLNKQLNKKVRHRARQLEKMGYTYMGRFGNKSGQPAGHPTGGIPVRNTHLKFKKGKHRVALKLMPVNNGWQAWEMHDGGTKVKRLKKSSTLASIYRDERAEGLALFKYLNRYQRKYGK